MPIVIDDYNIIGNTLSMVVDIESLTYRDTKHTNLFEGVDVRWVPKEEFQQWADQHLYGPYEITFEQLELPKLVLDNYEDELLVRLTWNK
jgi:hypothetical protein